MNAKKELSKRDDIKKSVLKLARAQNLTQLKSNLSKIGYNCANADFRCKSTWLAVEEFLKAKNTKATSFISGIKANWNKQYVNRNSQNLAYSR